MDLVILMKKNNFKIPDELILTEKRVDDFLKIDPNAFDNYNHRNIRVYFIIKTI